MLGPRGLGFGRLDMGRGGAGSLCPGRLALAGWLRLRPLFGSPAFLVMGDDPRLRLLDDDLFLDDDDLALLAGCVVLREGTAGRRGFALFLGDRHGSALAS